MRNMTYKKEKHSCINQKKHRTMMDNYSHRLKELPELAWMIQKSPEQALQPQEGRGLKLQAK